MPSYYWGPTTLVAAIPFSEKGAPGGVATLDGGGDVPAPQLDNVPAVEADPVYGAEKGAPGGAATLDGGGDVPAAQLGNTPPSPVTDDEFEDTVSGTFATAAAFPVFAAIPGATLLFVQGGLAPSDILVHIDAITLPQAGGAFIDGAVLGVSLDAGPIRVVEGATSQGIGEAGSNNVSGTVKFPAVAPGPHMLDLHLSNTAILSAVQRGATAPLRMNVQHR